MAFFELPKAEDLPPESRKMLEEYQRLTEITYLPPYAYPDRAAVARR